MPYAHETQAGRAFRRVLEAHGWVIEQAKPGRCKAHGAELEVFMRGRTGHAQTYTCERCYKEALAYQLAMREGAPIVVRPPDRETSARTMRSLTAARRAHARRRAGAA